MLRNFLSTCSTEHRVEFAVEYVFVLSAFFFVNVSGISELFDVFRNIEVRKVIQTGSMPMLHMLAV